MGNTKENPNERGGLIGLRHKDLSWISITDMTTKNTLFSTS